MCGSSAASSLSARVRVLSARRTTRCASTRVVSMRCSRPSTCPQQPVDLADQPLDLAQQRGQPRPGRDRVLERLAGPLHERQDVAGARDSGDPRDGRQAHVSQPNRAVPQSTPPAEVGPLRESRVSAPVADATVRRQRRGSGWPQPSLGGAHQPGPQMDGRTTTMLLDYTLAVHHARQREDQIARQVSEGLASVGTGLRWHGAAPAAPTQVMSPAMLAGSASTVLFVGSTLPIWSGVRRRPGTSRRTAGVTSVMTNTGNLVHTLYVRPVGRAARRSGVRRGRPSGRRVFLLGGGTPALAQSGPRAPRGQSARSRRSPRSSGRVARGRRPQDVANRTGALTLGRPVVSTAAQSGMAGDSPRPARVTTVGALRHANGSTCGRFRGRLT